MKTYDKYLSKFEEIVLSFSVLLMAFILIGGVIARAVFNSSWTFTEEVGQALNTIVTFFGIGYCAKKARHISMSVVYDLVNEKYKKAMMIIITLLTAIIMFYLTYLGIYYTMSVYELGRTTAALRIPMWIVVAPVPVGFFLGGIEYLRTFFLNITHKGEIFISSEFRLGENMDDAEFQEEKEGE